MVILIKKDPFLCLPPVIYLRYGEKARTLNTQVIDRKESF